MPFLVVLAAAASLPRLRSGRRARSPGIRPSARFAFDRYANTMADELTPEDPPVAEVGEKRKAEEGDADAAPDAKKEKKEWIPVTLGPKSFATPEEMIKYFSWILNNTTVNQDMNDYETMVVAECLKRAHPEATRKIGAGVKTFQIRNHPEHDTRCYMVLRSDGSSEDFSYRKCVEVLFPGFTPQVRSNAGGRGGGRGGARSARGRRGALRSGAAPTVP